MPAGLKRFLEPKKRASPGELCEFCTEPLTETHSHVVDVGTRGLMCACRSCYLLFAPQGAAGGKYRPVPEGSIYDPDFRLSRIQWDSLQIPVGIAFFFFHSGLGRTCAFYPSPAGATESLLSLETWDEIVRANPLLERLTPDVEALLVKRESSGEMRCYIVPIDACYELVGLIRRYWKGFDGGEEARRAIDGFFTALTERSRPPLARMAG